MGRSWGVWDGSFPDRKVFKSPSFPQINYTMKTIPSWAAAFCPAFPPTCWPSALSTRKSSSTQRARLSLHLP